ncbi:hypothetical protein L2E82_50758 [Cichorium intybus]|nr:hypothetical protein L2E82_50758 [Cichorium intybus]
MILKQHDWAACFSNLLGKHPHLMEGLATFLGRENIGERQLFHNLLFYPSKKLYPFDATVKEKRWVEFKSKGEGHPTVIPGKADHPDLKSFIQQLPVSSEGTSSIAAHIFIFKTIDTLDNNFGELHLEEPDFV